MSSAKAKIPPKSRPVDLALAPVDNALLATELYRRLRQSGRTVRSPIDMLQASYCITHGHTLLHRDADFESLKTLGGLDIWPQ